MLLSLSTPRALFLIGVSTCMSYSDASTNFGSFCFISWSVTFIILSASYLLRKKKIHAFIIKFNFLPTVYFMGIYDYITCACLPEYFCKLYCMKTARIYYIFLVRFLVQHSAAGLHLLPI